MEFNSSERNERCLEKGQCEEENKDKAQGKSKLRLLHTGGFAHRAPQPPSNSSSGQEE